MTKITKTDNPLSIVKKTFAPFSWIVHGPKLIFRTPAQIIDIIDSGDGPTLQEMIIGSVVAGSVLAKILGGSIIFGFMAAEDTSQVFGGLLDNNIILAVFDFVYTTFVIIFLLSLYSGMVGFPSLYLTRVILKLNHGLNASNSFRYLVFQSSNLLIISLLLSALIVMLENELRFISAYYDHAFSIMWFLTFPMQMISVLGNTLRESGAVAGILSIGVFISAIISSYQLALWNTGGRVLLSADIAFGYISGIFMVMFSVSNFVKYIREMHICLSIMMVYLVSIGMLLLLPLGMVTYLLWKNKLLA